MATDAERLLRGAIRKGTISSVNPAAGTARVTFDDKGGAVSPELKLLHMFSGPNKDFWMPDIGEQVVCNFETNDKNFSTGWILGSYFTDRMPPQVQSADIRRVDFSDGTFFEYNRATSTLTVNCVGDVVVKGATINLN